jgi:RNA polymerase sigma-70 factor (ECF subfamily)
VDHEDTNRAFDALLVTLCQSGDRRAADRLAARWQPRLVRTARRLLRDDDLARDAVQEAWLGICRGWGGLHDPAQFPAWAFAILHRKCADAMRRRSRQRAVFIAHDVMPEAAGEDADAHERIAIDRAMAALSFDHRAAALLFFGEGLTLAEIARVTSVPLGTAKSRVFNARLQLKAALGGETP